MERPVFGKPVPAPTTFDRLAARAAEKGFRLERGDPSRCHGARTGYILWRRGTWVQFRNLAAVEEAIESTRAVGR